MRKAWRENTYSARPWDEKSFSTFRETPGDTLIFVAAKKEGHPCEGSVERLLRCWNAWIITGTHSDAENQ